MKKYKLYDAYEEKELLAECDTMAEVRKVAASAMRKRTVNGFRFSTS